MKEKKKKIIILSIAIVAVIAIIAGSTYAYWQITKTQETPNDIVAACLDLNLEDKSAAIDLDSAWPISDEEGANLTGYTFTVTNNCDEEINYIVGLNRVEESNYLQDSSIRLKLDEKSAFTYSELSDIDYADAENTYTSRVSKQVSVERIEANGSNEHTIRVWLSESAPVSEQSKIFQGQVFITGGQGIEMEACYEIADNGTILSYDYSCGTDVKVPAEINGIKIKTINENSFKTLHAIGIQTLKGSQQGLFVVYFDETNREVLDAAMLNYVCEELNVCGVPSVSYIGTILSEEEYNSHDWSQYDRVYNIEFTIDNETGELIDQSDDGQYQQVTSLDLSEAVFLESIEEHSFDKSLIETLILPEENIISIGEFAFYKTKLKTLNFNKSLSDCGEGAFAGNSFDEFIVSDNNYVDIGNILYDDDSKTPSDFSLIKKLIIKSNITEVPSDAFRVPDYSYGEYDIEEVVFEDTEENPSQLVSIGARAFEGNNITNLTLPSQLISINYRAFAANNLTKIELPKTLTELSYSAFHNNNITEIKINNNELANSETISILPVKKVIISANVTEIPENAFKSYALEEVVFEDTTENPSQLMSIGAYAFSSVKITNLDLPNSLKRIGDYAFYSNDITSLTIPSSIETIGNYAFAFAGNLSNLAFEDTELKPSQLKKIGFYAFGGNELEGVIVLPSFVTNLSDFVFGDNYDITTIVIKRTEEDALANISFSNDWNYVDDIGAFDVGTPTTGFAEVIYDPNYTE